MTLMEATVILPSSETYMKMVRVAGGAERVLLLGVLLPDVLWQLCHMRLLKNPSVCVSVCAVR